MKNIYALLIALGFISGLAAQSCLPEGITFTRQSQVDSFSIQYPDCTTLEGFLVIGKCAGTNINSLEGLSQLTSVGRFMHIYTNDSLPDLTGLHNLTFINGDLIIGTMLYGAYCGNDSLRDLTGLNSLEYINGRLVILGNEQLENLSGLESLGFINGSISIQANNLLSSLQGLENISAASITELYFVNNFSLSGCDIKSICDFLYRPGVEMEIRDNSAGCSSIEEAASACGLGIDEYIDEDRHLLIYPNPATSLLSIELSSEPCPNTMLTVSSINGQGVISKPVKKIRTDLDITNLPAGIYVVKVWDDDKVMVGKMIKN